MALKKRWYDIIAPKMFGEKVIGETLSADPKQLVGRRIDLNLMELSRKYSKFYIKILLQIEKLEDGKAYTKLIGHECLRERIYRMVQRRLRRVDVIQDITTKDGKKVRIKTVFVLLRRVGTSLRSAARKKAKDAIERIASSKDLENLMEAIISGDFQNEVRKEVNKIYPVGNLEIRKTEISQ